MAAKSTSASGANSASFNFHPTNGGLPRPDRCVRGPAISFLALFSFDMPYFVGLHLQPLALLRRSVAGLPCFLTPLQYYIVFSHPPTTGLVRKRVSNLLSVVHAPRK